MDQSVLYSGGMGEVRVNENKNLSTIFFIQSINGLSYILRSRRSEKGVKISSGSSKNIVVQEHNRLAIFFGT